MGSTWLKVFLGQKPSEAEIAHVQHPRLEMATHVTFKMVQVGTVCGVAIVGPILVAMRGNPSLFRVARYAAKYGQIGALSGFVLGPALSIAQTKHMELETVARQCHKLRLNKSQVWSDRLTVAGFGGGYGLAVLLGESPAALAVFGICGGVLLSECVSAALPRSQSYHTDIALQDKEELKSL